jgi:hypothetical protein
VASLTTPPIRFTPAHVFSTVVGSDGVGGDDVVSWEDVCNQTLLARQKRKE